MDINSWQNSKLEGFMSILYFINKIYKDFRATLPLKDSLQYILESYDLTNVKLYQKDGATFSVVPPNAHMQNKNFIELLFNIYQVLDSTQIGISFSDKDLKPFKNYYLEISELPDFTKPPTKNSENPNNINFDFSRSPSVLTEYTTNDVTANVYILNDKNDPLLTQNRKLKEKIISLENKLLKTEAELLDKGQDNLSITDQQDVKAKEIGLMTASQMGKLALAPEDNHTDKLYESELREIIKNLEKRNHELEETNKTLKATMNNLDTDWNKIDNAIYPSELHLAFIIWKKAYLSKEINNKYLTKHSERFDIIVKKIGLHDYSKDNALMERIRTITTPHIKKTKGISDQLKNVEELRVKELLIKNR